MTGDDTALAAEYVLGLLDDSERRAARERVLADRAFAAEVARWQAWLAALLDAYPEMAPPERLEQRIADAVMPRAAVAAPPRGWRWAGLATLAAAVLVFAMVLGPVRSPPPVPAPVTPAPAPAPLLAALTVQDGQAVAGRGALAATVNRATGEIRIAGTAAAPRRRDAQVWATGGDGTPVPLGLLAATGPTRLTVAAPRRALLAAGTTLAISIEPVGGSPTGAPTGPVIAAGALAAS
jgi:anti-sigma-K factor RskA